MSMLAIILPHRRAAELIDEQLDAERGEAPLLREDADWLESHLARCEKCAEQLAERRMLMNKVRSIGSLKAPAGFAGRVMMRAKTRKVEEPEVREGVLRPLMPLSQLAMGASLVAVLAVSLGVMLAVGPGEAKKSKGLEATSVGQTMAMNEAPHFIVRAPGLGAAKARREITQVVEAHRGTFSETGSTIVARIPRSDLVGVTQDLANRASFRMTKADAGELSAGVDTIVLRFELD